MLGEQNKLIKHLKGRMHHRNSEQDKDKDIELIATTR